MTPVIKGVYVVDVTGIFPHRKTKHCICVSVGKNKYLPINTTHRDEYNDFLINASDYKFLGGENRYVACSELMTLHPDKLIKKAGQLSDVDAKNILAKLEKAKTIPKNDQYQVIAELARALS